MRKKYIPAAVIAGVLLIGGIIAVLWAEKNKKNPIENYTEKNTGTDLKNGDGTAEPDSGLVTDGVAEFVYDDPVINSNIKHTFLAYDFVDGSEITAQTKYPDDWFSCSFSDDGSPQATRRGKYVDIEQFEKDEPELCEEYYALCESFGGVSFEGYSSEEVEDIMERYSAAEEKYSTWIDYEISYVFLQCRFENLSGSEQTLNVNNMEGMMDKGDFAFGYVCYFNKPQQSDKSYFKYVMQPNETLECVIGVAYSNVTMNTKDISAPSLDELYFGYLDSAMYDAYCEGTSPYSPVYGKYVFKVSRLNEMEG